MSPAYEIRDLLEVETLNCLWLTETLLADRHHFLMTDLLPPNYKILWVDRLNKIGGGVAVVYKDYLELSVDNSTVTISDCELLTL